MKKDEVKINGYYRMKHSSGFIDVQILRTHTIPGRNYGIYSGRTSTRTRNHWIAKNLKSGREITIKSAEKLWRELTQEEIAAATA